MNAGQIVAQMPVAAAQPVAAQASPPTVSSPRGDQESSVFAGVLRSVSSHESARPVSHTDTVKPVQAEAVPQADTSSVVLQSGASATAMATLVAVMGTGVQELSSGLSNGKAGEEQQKSDGSSMCPQAQLLQNAVLCAVQPQIAAAPLTNGRMPDAEQKPAISGAETIAADQAVNQSLVSGSAALIRFESKESDNSNSVKNSGAVLATVSDNVVERSGEAVSQKGVPGPDAAEQNSAVKPLMVNSAFQNETGVAAAVALKKVHVNADSQNAARSTTNNEVHSTETASSPATPARNSAVVQAIDVQQQPASMSYTSAASVARTVPPELAVNVQAASLGSEALRASKTTAVQNVIVGTTAVADIPVTSTANPELSTSTASPVLTEIAVPAASLRSNMEAYFQTSIRPVVSSPAVSATPAEQTAVPLPVTDAPEDTHPALDAGQRPVRGEMKFHNELMAAEEQPVLRQGSAPGNAKADGNVASVMTGTAKESSTTTSGEEFGRNGNGSGEQKFAGQANLAMMHQVTVDKALPAVATPTVAVSDPLKTDQSDHIASQVKDHMAGREIKTGVEQVVIRLSPENLGELKMNLRMENQRLKVEIVAETPMVRDSLMKHADSLKESLARQNITMESFDVSTGSNKQGSASQSQGDWRELARQRQYNSWASADGYKLGNVPEMPIRPVYQASTGTSMLDVHF